MNDMKWSDLIGFMKNGKKWSEIKEAQEFFESKEDLDTFLASGWSIDDLKEAKEMIDTNPTSQKIDKESMEKGIDHVASQIENMTGLEIPENEKHYDMEDIGASFKKLAKGE